MILLPVSRYSICQRGRSKEFPNGLLNYVASESAVTASEEAISGELHPLSPRPSNAPAGRTFGGSIGSLELDTDGAAAPAARTAAAHPLDRATGQKKGGMEGESDGAPGEAIYESPTEGDGNRVLPPDIRLAGDHGGEIGGKIHDLPSSGGQRGLITGDDDGKLTPIAIRSVDETGGTSRDSLDGQSILIGSDGKEGAGGASSPTHLKWAASFEDTTTASRVQRFGSLRLHQVSRWITIRDVDNDILAGRYLQESESPKIGQCLEIDGFQCCVGDLLYEQHIDSQEDKLQNGWSR